MLAGSQNVSRQAFEGKNYEVGILRRSGNADRFSDLLGIAELIKNSKLIDLSVVHMRFRPETALSRGHIGYLSALSIGWRQNRN